MQIIYRLQRLVATLLARPAARDPLERLTPRQLDDLPPHHPQGNDACPSGC